MFYEYITKYTDIFVENEGSFCTLLTFFDKNIGIIGKLTSENLTTSLVLNNRVRPVPQKTN